MRSKIATVFALITTYNALDVEGQDGKCGNRVVIRLNTGLKWCGYFADPVKCNESYTERTLPFKECKWNTVEAKCVTGSDCPESCSGITAFGRGIVSQGKLNDCMLNTQMAPGSTCNVKCDETKGYLAQVGTYMCPQRGGTATTSLRCTTASVTATTISETLDLEAITSTVSRSKAISITTAATTTTPYIQDKDGAATGNTMAVTLITTRLLRSASRLTKGHRIVANAEPDNLDAAPQGVILPIIVAGSLVFITAIIIVIVVVCIRKKKQDLSEDRYSDDNNKSGYGNSDREAIRKHSSFAN